MDFYHTLNRGVDKRDIFMDDYDRLRFVHDLFEFNNTENATTVYYLAQSWDVGRPNTNHQKLVDIHFFCLMSNHYHLLLSPLVENGIPLFMKKLNGGYAKYFNEKYKRSGALFQGKYRSVIISEDPHFNFIPFYIHFNPLDTYLPEWRDGKLTKQKAALDFLLTYQWSSHLDYLGKPNFPLVTNREFFLDLYEGKNGYEESVREALVIFDPSEFSHTLE
jgi:putative transposase